MQVVYALRDRQVVIDLEVPAGTTLREAVERSGIGAQISGFELGHAALGVHGQLRPVDTPVQAGDRIEIYRPLQADPKQARRVRAQGRRKATGKRG